MNLLLALLCCNMCNLEEYDLSDTSSQKVVIVGAGPAGIAAASRLLENGFTDVTILEAEDRIGGRIHSMKVGKYMIDMGAQWVHGEENNVVFELVWPLGLLERMRENFDIEINYFLSSGKRLPVYVSNYLIEVEASVEGNITDIEDLEFTSFGEYAETKYKEYFKDYPGIHRDLHNTILHSLNLAEMMGDGANNWFDVSVKGLRDYAECNGDYNINWKNRTYSTILDILIKKYPNPEEKLPVVENTIKNTAVTHIDYSDDSIQISTADGKKYSADHVIFTPSLGVLKANYEQLFNPPLPEMKAKAIENLGFGHVAKIWLYYDNPWWDSSGHKFIVNPIVWTSEDGMKMAFGDPEFRWMYGIYGVMSVEHKPNFLCLWVASDRSIEMESIPEEIFRAQIMGILMKFYDRHYRVTRPTRIIRTSWNTNENFLGTYSYLSVDADQAGVSYADLAEPIIRNNEPVLQFAGEATAEHYSTVHGAIESGWREADRLIDLYSKRIDASRLLEQLTVKSII